MTLRFDSISLQNFGPYRRLDDLDLRTSDDAPVVMIYGENTLGKTSLFKAFRWCLYGSPEPGKTADQATRGLIDFLNRPARREGETQMKVAMTFTAGGHVYKLARTAAFSQSGVKTSADLRIDASVVLQSSIESEIGRLLHPQISEFFLFDGELLRDFYDRLNTDRERDLLRGSIENVLGIPALQLADNDVRTMKSDVVQRQAKAIKSKADADAAQQKLRELNSQHESLEKDRLEVDESLRRARAQLEDVRERIAAVEELKADAREMQGLEASIAGSAAEEARIKQEMARLLIAGWMAPAAVKLRRALERVIERNNSAQRRVRELAEARTRVSVLENQVEGSTCPTCHQILPPPSEATMHELAQEREHLHGLEQSAASEPDLALERRIRELIDDRTAELYREKQAQLDRIEADQFTRQRRLATIKDRMRDNDAARIRQLGDEQDALEQAIVRFEHRLGEINTRKAEVAASQDKHANTIRRLSNDGAFEVDAEAAFFEYAQHLLARTIDRYREHTRASVEKVATESFAKLVRDPESYGGVHIGTDYSVELLSRRGERINTSEGGKQLVALSLIGALKDAAVRGGPVVLDSPLARLDQEHRANVLRRWIPELGDQAILLLQSGELTPEQGRELIGAKIGSEYRIRRPNGDPEVAEIERLV